VWSGCQESTARKFFGELDDFRPEVFFLISPNVQFPHKQKFVDTSGQSFRLQERKKQQNKKITRLSLATNLIEITSLQLPAWIASSRVTQVIPELFVWF